MNLNVFPYSKERRRFGRQPLFSDRNELLFDERAYHRYFAPNYILKNPIDVSTQLSDQKGFSEVETENAVLAHHGMLHVEGGWPKDVNYLDEEASLRHRKKAERDDNYAKQLLSLTKPVMSAVQQNIAVNIYEEYFIDTEPVELRRQFTAVTMSVFHDILPPPIRPVLQLGWSPSESPKFLSLHSSYNRYDPPSHSTDFYVWDIDNPLKPLSILTSEPHVTTRANICPRDENLIAGGLKNGMAVVWDTRTGGVPVNICPLEVAHRDSVSALCWVHSKSNTEFYTGSTDGSICYWDGRNMKKYLQRLLLDPVHTNDQVMSRAHGVSVLEFEYTIPIRYMACSELGYLFIGNRKGFTPNENLITNYRVMNGPVRSIERNPFFVKNFLVIGEWCAKIWTEECKDYPLTRFPPQASQLMCGVWSPTRCSLFFTGNEAGELDFWDLLLDYKKPVFTMRQFKSTITAMSAKEDGKILAVATAAGDVYLVKLDEPFVKSGPKDKTLISAMFERELQRCKLLEGRVREIKLNAVKNNLSLTLDSMLDIRLLPKAFTDEDEPYDDMSIYNEDIEEEEEAIDPSREGSIIAAQQQQTGFSEDGEPYDDEYTEEGENETVSDLDPELTEIRARFLSIVNDEIQRNREKVYIMEPCDFDLAPINLEDLPPSTVYSSTIPDTNFDQADEDLDSEF